MNDSLNQAFLDLQQPFRLEKKEMKTTTGIAVCLMLASAGCGQTTPKSQTNQSGEANMATNIVNADLLFNVEGLT